MIDREIICIVCPVSCRLKITGDKVKDDRHAVTGAECYRGIKYGLSEIGDPRRIFTSTVIVNGGEIGLVPVRSDKPIKKDRWKKAAEIVKGLETGAPVGFGTVMMKDFTERGINLIATRKIKER